VYILQNAILAEKIGTTQLFDEGHKEFFLVTVLRAGPCVVTQVKTKKTDGYFSIQVGFDNLKKNRVNKPLKGKFEKINIAPKKFLREFRLVDTEKYKVGDEIKVNVFAIGDKIDASGVSKGKGFQGVIKRHGHHRGPMSHGSKYHRSVGSMSSATTPGRVKKGKKMPGHMGAQNVTVQNLEVVRVDVGNNLLIVKGSVPGPKKSLIVIKNSVKSKRKVIV
jgi:large subunit ribosomal protein L3